MRFGFQISIAGGLSKVINRAKITKCETIQLFTRNPRQWKNIKLDKNEVDKFKTGIEKENIYPIIVHMPYLPNLASPDDDLWQKSINYLSEELLWAKILSAKYIVIHIGKKKTLTLNKAIERVITGINIAFNNVRNDIILLLENTAGQGTEIGYNFSQIKEIICGINDKKRVGICLDTAHLFQAGYDIRTKKGIYKTIEEFDKLIGIKNLFLLHINDSKTTLGSRIDRHYHIGEGAIGERAFFYITHHPLLLNLPAILETPRKNDSDDIKNISKIRKIYSDEKTQDFTNIKTLIPKF